ncbi:MAG: SDR family NAD(P)-dependent oxidoreductase [Spirochaetaceae bacterium]
MKGHGDLRKGKLDGRVVWITGASAGIGAELAAGCAARGARTVLTARREEALRRTQERCGGAERSAVVTADLADLDGLEAVTEAAWSAFGRIDMVVLNAAVSQRGTAVDTDSAVVRKVHTLNYLSPVAILRHLVPRMIEVGSGRVVGVSTLATRVPTPQRSAYAASKIALETHLVVLRRELQGTGLAVTLALPGFVRTEISKHALNADGSLHGVVDEVQRRGMPPEVCADRILRGILRGRREVRIPSDCRTRIGMFLHRYAPGLLDRLIARARVT